MKHLSVFCFSILVLCTSFARIVLFSFQANQHPESLKNPWSSDHPSEFPFKKYFGDWIRVFNTFDTNFNGKYRYDINSKGKFVTLVGTWNVHFLCDGKMNQIKGQNTTGVVAPASICSENMVHFSSMDVDNSISELYTYTARIQTGPIGIYTERYFWEKE